MLLGLQVALRLKGVPELVRALAEIDKKVARKALRDAVKAAHKPVLKAEKAAVRVETKALKKALGHREKSYQGGKVAVSVVGVRKDKKGKPFKFKRRVKTANVNRDVYRNPVKYAHLVEFGTRPHSLKKGDRLARQARGKRPAPAAVQSPGRPHPGAKAHPFVGPAKRKNVRTVRSIMVGVLQRALAEARKKK